jgi:hypothetical protein
MKRKIMVVRRSVETFNVRGGREYFGANGKVPSVIDFPFQGCFICKVGS